MRYVDNSPIENPYSGKPYLHVSDEEREAAEAEGRAPKVNTETRPAHLIRSYTARFNEVEPKATHGDTTASVRLLNAITKAGGPEAEVIALEDADYDWLRKSWEKDNRGSDLFGVMGGVFYATFLEAPKEAPGQPGAAADGAPSENANVVSLAGRP